MKELRAILERLNRVQEEPTVLATLVSIIGSSYRRPGARLLMMNNGDHVGSISGGCLEEDVLAHARRVRETGVPTVIKYDTTSENELVWGVGLGCHGIVQVLVEPLLRRPEWAQVLSRNWDRRETTNLAVTWSADSTSELGTRLTSSEPDQNARHGVSIFFDQIPPPTRLLIFGAGNDARPLHRIAAELGWDVVVADPRPAYATAARFPAARQVISAPAECLVARSQPDAHSVAVVMTHHYVHDLPILRDLLPLQLPYLGLLGPKKRGEKILADLAAAGSATTFGQRAALHSPVGLDIGAETPEEVAISIIAEIRTALSGRKGGSLKNRERPIHG